jgi:dTDP-4-amino-4,6-dideoxygalactose transaminase
MSNIPFLNFEPMHKKIRKQMISAFEEVFDSNWYIMGKRLELFENNYSKFNQVKHTVGVSNGLDALFLALKSLGITKDDEVIVPSNTYIATVLAVTSIGAKPVFVEPCLSSYNINPKLIEAAITSKTKAIIPVHLYGQACEMMEINEIAVKYNLFIVEDNAQAHGASFAGKLTGSWGHVNGTSFYPGKNLGALGDAGAITTDSEEIAKKIKVLRNYGSQKKYHNEVIGYNMRLDELQASLLSIKLGKLNEWTKQRQEIATFYNKFLKNIDEIILPKTANGATHVYHLYVIRTPKREALQNYLNERGIGTLIHYPIPPHLQDAYKNLGFTKGDFPISEELSQTCLSLPIWPGMKKDQVLTISNEIKYFFEKK